MVEWTLWAVTALPDITNVLGWLLTSNMENSKTDGCLRPAAQKYLYLVLHKHVQSFVKLIAEWRYSSRWPIKFCYLILIYVYHSEIFVFAAYSMCWVYGPNQTPHLQSSDGWHKRGRNGEAKWRSSLLRLVEQYWLYRHVKDVDPLYRTRV